MKNRSILPLIFCGSFLRAHLFSSLRTTTAAVGILLLLIVGGASSRPNILLLITDDQDVILRGTDYMPLLKQYIIQEGVTFQNGFCHTPICCPSRSSILTGRYLHNHGSINNSVSGNCNGAAWQQGPEQYTIGVMAQQAGYQTAFAGKYLNQYGTRGAAPGCVTGNESACHRVPPGWDRWMGLVGNSRYYDYDTVQSNDGGKTVVKKHHGSVYAEDYFPDLVANRTLKCLEDFVSRSQQPFFMEVAWPSPHAPFTPAPDYQESLSNLTATRTPNWNASHMQNLQKHWMMRRLGPVDSKTVDWIDNSYRQRLRTLLSVDQHIYQFVKLLADNGQLDNTFIVYSSDNGWQYGQHRLAGDKRMMYEHDIRVPFFMRGPGIPKGAAVDRAVLNIDIAPTIADIVNSTLQEGMDGQSFLQLALHSSNHSLSSSSWRRDFLVSYHGEANPTCGLWTCPPPAPENDHGMDSGTMDAFNNTYHCLRSMSPEYIYCRFEDDEDFVEYYDLQQDPWQLHNAVHELSPQQRVAMEARLVNLRHCRGASCRRTDETTISLERN